MTPEAGAVAAALMGAFAYGAGDFLGGRASLRLSTPVAVTIAQTVALAYMAMLYMQSEYAAPDIFAWEAGVVAGLSYAAGLMLLYHGFAYGRIGIVAPLCGLFAILIPLAADIRLERGYGERSLLGIGFCALAVVLIAGSCLPEESKASAGRSVWMGAASGIGYGVADVVLALVPSEQTNATLLVTRGVAAFAGVAVLGYMMLATGRAIVPAPVAHFSGSTRSSVLSAASTTGIILAAVAGAFDLFGQIGYIVSASYGSMGLAAALVALFPAVSVGLAIIVLREPVTTRQIWGFAASVAGVLIVSI